MNDLAKLVQDTALAANASMVSGYEAGLAEGWRSGVQAAADLIERGLSNIETSPLEAEFLGTPRPFRHLWLTVDGQCINAVEAIRALNRKEK